MTSKLPATALLSAILLAAAAHAQGDFDPEKVKALFAGTEWCVRGLPGEGTVTFAGNGRASCSGSVSKKIFEGSWNATGERKIAVGDTTLELSADGRQLYATVEKKSFHVLWRGKNPPPPDPAVLEALAKPGIVWMMLRYGKRETFAFSPDSGFVMWGRDGKVEEWKWYQAVGNRIVYMESNKWQIHVYLIRNEKGEYILKGGDEKWHATYSQEPAQPGDPLPPQKVSRAKSPFGGTAWCGVDGKGKPFTVTFMANGTVSDSALPNEKPEWNHYEDGTVRYRISDKTRRLILDAEKNRLVREDEKTREVWFPGRALPKMGLAETKRLKDALADPSKVWVYWDEGKAHVYTFDNKSGNVSITVDDGQPQTFRWEPLCAGCIRVGEDVFMLEGDTLQRVEPRLTLQSKPLDAVAPGAAAPLAPQSSIANRQSPIANPAPPSNTLPAAEFDALYAAASAKFPADLAKLHATYTNTAVKLDRDRVNIHARALEEYAAGVDRAAKLYASRGDLPGAKAAREAKDNAYRGDAFTDATQPELLALAAAWTKTRADADARHDAQLLDLLGKYANALTGLIKARLQKGDIDGAEPIQLEIDWADRIRHATQTRAVR